jgi:hypothetical protein
MTDIEALLSVDAGRVPPGAMAFFLGDAEVVERRTYVVLGVTAAAAGAICAGLGGGRVVVMLLLLAAAALLLLATPTLGDDEDRAVKRPVIVVTSNALMMRDECGLRIWPFEDLASVAAAIHDQRAHLLLVGTDGKRHVVDCLRFRNGERVREVVDQRLQSLRA